MNKRETDTIADIWSHTRGLAKWYLNKFNSQQLITQPEFNGKELHSPVWLMAHLAWAQNDLGLLATGGKGANVDWLNDFRFRAPENKELVNSLAYDELMKDVSSVHEQAMIHIRQLPLEKLDEDVDNMFKTVRGTLYHCIRHEGVHIGHLGLLCKLNDVETI